MAGKNQSSKAKLAGPVHIRHGPLVSQETVYVAPIKDDMLLGVDYLNKHAAEINFEDHTIQVRGVRLPMNSSDGNYSAKVYPDHDTFIPSMNAVKVKCVMDKPLTGRILIAPKNEQDVLTPWTLCQDKDNIQVLICNWTNEDVTVPRGYPIGTASIPQEVLEEQESVGGMSQGESTGPNIRVCSTFPEHLRPLLDESKKGLDDEQVAKLEQLLSTYQDVFAKSDFDLGDFTAVSHSIDTGQAAPIKQGLRRTPLHFRGEEDGHLNKMLTAGVIQPSVSEWASPPVLVRKRDGTVRWCVDYRALNAITRKDVFPLPRIEECVDALEGNIWFSKLDANSAYWQVRLDDDSRPKTAFTTRRGLFEFVRMPFGLCNAPATFSRVINLILSGLNWETVLAFLDDICVLGRSFEDHLHNLEGVFKRFRKYGLRMKPRKCSLFKKEVEFLGRLVSKNGVQLMPESIRAVSQWPELKSVKDVQKFIGLTNYHRLFIKSYSSIAEPLFKILRENEFHWTDAERAAFQALKTALTSTPVLGIPTSTDPFILDTDASNFAIGAELIQVQNGQERVIGYGSYTLSKEQRRYCTTRKELLAVIRFIRQFRPYLLGRRFTVRTDHSSLRWLAGFKEPQGQLARWLEELSQYDVEIVHRPGRHHGNADALSRRPAESDCTIERNPLDSLPCGGCNYCQRIQRSWKTFQDEIDDVVPLSSGVLRALRAAAIPTDNETFEPRASTWEEQQKDGVLRTFVEWLRGEEPDEGSLGLASPELKHMWMSRELFVIKDDVLYRIHPQTRQHQVVVSQQWRTEILALAHDVPTAGHQGINRTKERLKRYWWYRRSSEVKSYINTCSNCNAMKKASTPTPHYPMQLYH